MSGWVAIDFGAMRTKLAYPPPNGAAPELLIFGSEQRPFTPSLFHCPPQGHIEFGDSAQAAARQGAGAVDYLARRRWGDGKIGFNTRAVSPTELLRTMFTTLRAAAAQGIAALQNAPPDAAMLTVPAAFDPRKVQVLRAAAHEAGFVNTALAEEPVCVARAWMSEAGGSANRVVVFDCGGGAVTATLLSLDLGSFRVVPACPPSSPNQEIGGYSIDFRLFDLLRPRLERIGVNLEPQLLVEEARRIKEQLVTGEEPSPLWFDGGVGVRLSLQELREVIDREFVAPAVDMLRGYLQKVALATGSQDPPPVLLCGGGARLAGLREAVSRLGCQVVTWDRADNAVVLGALARAGAQEPAVTARQPQAQPTPRAAPAPTVVSRDILTRAAGIIENLAAAAGRNDLEEIKQKFREQIPRPSPGPFSVIIGGAAGSGRTTLINALLRLGSAAGSTDDSDGPVVPNQIRGCTEVHYAAEPFVRVKTAGGEETWTRGRYRQSAGATWESGIESVKLGVPAGWLHDGLCLVKLPDRRFNALRIAGEKLAAGDGCATVFVFSSSNFHDRNIDAVTARELLERAPYPLVLINLICAEQRDRRLEKRVTEMLTQLSELRQLDDKVVYVQCRNALQRDKADESGLRSLDERLRQIRSAADAARLPQVVSNITRLVDEAIACIRQRGRSPQVIAAELQRFQANRDELAELAGRP